MNLKDAKDIENTLKRSLSDQFNSERYKANKGYSYSTQIVQIEENEAEGYRHETWLDAQGKIHRNGGPAVSLIVKGVVKSESWYQHGVMHRDDGPALFHQYGCVIIEDWYRNGEKIDKPGQVTPAPKV